MKKIVVERLGWGPVTWSLCAQDLPSLAQVSSITLAAEPSSRNSHSPTHLQSAALLRPVCGHLANAHSSLVVQQRCPHQESTCLMPSLPHR